MSVSSFSDEFLGALGAWQNGWKEDIQERTNKSIDLLAYACDLPSEFRHVNEICYRKFFLTDKTIADVVLRGAVCEGVSSWTTDYEYAKEFKGIIKPEATIAAIFECRPRDDDVVVNLAKLWGSEEFRESVSNYTLKNGPNCKALNNFKDNQSEVVINARLTSDSIICLSGSTSDFDELCDEEGITDDQKERQRIFMELHNQKIFPGEIGYLEGNGCQRVLKRVRDAWLVRKM